MTKRERGTDGRGGFKPSFGHWFLVIGHSFAIRISPFVILTVCTAAGPTTAPTTAPSVEQRIGQLLAPPPVVVRKAMPPPHGRAAKPGAFLRDGATIDEALARLGHTADGRTAVLTFLPDGDRPTLPPMVVLPNRELEGMERQQADDGGGPATFRVWGLVTEYKGRNYVRVDRSTVAGDDRAVPRAADASRTDRTSGAAATAPGAPAVSLVRDGTYLTTRTGRLNLSADGKTATLTFDADRRTMRDPPMIVLPNAKLAAMESQRAGLFKDVKFRVSGTVTAYGGRNYILLDKAVAAQDFDVDF